MATEELFREDGYMKSCTATVTGIATDLPAPGVITDRTVFYPNGGGQPGDTGVLVCSDGREIQIVDTFKHRESGEHVHLLAEGAQGPAQGDSVDLKIDWDRRYRLMRMHSCMHMLCATIDAPVTGGSIQEARGRLDFDLPEPVDKVQITAKLNELIETNQPMTLQWITDEELDAEPDLVRTMSAPPPRGAGRVRLVRFAEIDLQPCGGTHVANSGEIGRVRVRKIEKKGKQNRRVIVEFDESQEA